MLNIEESWNKGFDNYNRQYNYSLGNTDISYKWKNYVKILLLALTNKKVGYRPFSFLDQFFLTNF